MECSIFNRVVVCVLKGYKSFDRSNQFAIVVIDKHTKRSATLNDTTLKCIMCLLRVGFHCQSFLVLLTEKVNFIYLVHVGREFFVPPNQTY